MTLHSRVCFVKLTEYIAITLKEKTCLSVCRGRQCPTVRSDLLSKVARGHRLGLCSTNKKSKNLPSARQKFDRGAASFIHGGKEWETNTSSRSEMPVWTVSQKFCHPQWGRLSKELWGRPTMTADFRSSFRQIPYTSHVCLLEEKIQDWGLYLFTISYGSYAMDQRNGDGWFSGWFKIFVINKRYSNAKFWSTRCEDCFSTEQHHP